MKNTATIHSAGKQLADILLIQENEQLRRENQRLLNIIHRQQADLAEQNSREAARSITVDRLSNIIANLQDGVLLESEHRTIVLVNQHFCDLFAIPVSPNQLEGLDYSGMAEQSKNYFKEPVLFVERVNQLLHDQKPIIGEELDLADGRIFERDYVPIFINNIYAGHLWRYADITKRKRAEDAALRQKEKYQRIIENMNLGLIEVDLDEHIVYTNQSFCAMSGYEPDELVGNIATEILLKGQNAELMKAKNDSRLKGTSDAYEVAIKNKRGEAMWWLISGAPLLSETGAVIGSTGIHLDITNQKQLESELRVAKQEAEHSARAKELFLANMSHEIRTPMNAILNLGQQLTKTALSDQQHFFLNTINTAASNLLVIINDVLDFSKIEAGQLTLEKIEFSLPDLLQRAVHVMTHSATDKGLSLTATIDPGLTAMLLGDPFRLNQILMNLIGNAIKFTDVGSVHVNCTGQRNGLLQHVDITVSDTGIGMDPHFQQNLFAKFTQEDSSIGRQYGGTGLGMSITKQLVDLMGGTIWVESLKNKGTTIHIQLSFPVDTKTTPVTDDPKNQQAHTSLVAKRILLVEDNDMNRLVATTILEPYGVIITEATNGSQAVDILQSKTFDLVLMDVQMPVMDGLEATRLIRAQISPTIPIIALTASAVRSEEEACYGAGMNDFLAKPFGENELVAKLAKWLQTSNVVEDTVAATTTTQIPLYDLSTLETIGRGNKAFIQKMVSLFCTDAPVVASQMKQAYRLGEFKTVQSLAHRIKPSIDNVGLLSQKESIRQLEQLAATAAHSSELEQLILDFEKTISEVVADMQRQYLTS